MAALTAVPTEDYFPVFGIETDKVEDSVFYIAENPSSSADEAAIFKAVDETYAKTLERILDVYKRQVLFGFIHRQNRVWIGAYV